MKTYKEFIITAEPFNADMLSGILWELDIKGINEDENSLTVFADSESQLSAEKIIQLLKKLQEENLLNNFHVKESIIEEKNWNVEWEKSLNVIRITDRIVIKPSFKEYEKQDDEIVITIDPKMSFGTGEHQTTKLMLLSLEKYLKKGIKVLDAGTGTGILAIASVKLGASEVIAFDNDESCYENAKENNLINDVSGKVEIRIGGIDIVPENDFDMIAANIHKNILISYKEQFSKKLKPNGIIIISGLLEDEEDIIKTEYAEDNLRHIETKKMDEWVALIFKKKAIQNLY